MSVKKKYAYLLVFCMALSLFGAIPAGTAKAAGDKKLMMAFIDAGENGRFELPADDSEQWVGLDNDKTYHVEAFNNKLVAFALEDSEGNKTLLTEDVTIFTADYDENSKICTKTEENVTNDVLESYRYWNDQEQKEETVPGLYNLRFWDGRFIAEYDDCSMPLSADRPFIGIYTKNEDGSGYQYESWDRHFNYQEDAEYYVGISVWLDQDDGKGEEDWKKGLHKFEISGTDDYFDISEKVIFEKDHGLILRKFTVKEGTIRRFDLICDASYQEYEGQEEWPSGTEYINCSCVRGGLAIAWTDRDNFKDNYDDYQKCFDELSLKTQDKVSIAIVSPENEEERTVAPVADIEKLSFSDPYNVEIEEFHKDYDKDKEVVKGVYEITFKKTGVYTVTYTDGDVTSTAEFVVGYPTVGLYSDKSISDDYFLCAEYREFEYKRGETYYILVSGYDGGHTVLTADLPADWGYNEPLTWDSEEAATAMSFTVPDDAVGNYDVHIHFLAANKDNDDEIWEDRDSNFNLKAVREGLVIRWPVWEESGYQFVDDLEDHQGDSYDKEKYISYRTDNQFTFGLLGQDEKVSPVNDISTLTLTKNGETVPIKDCIKKAADPENEFDGLFDVFFEEQGEYILTYTKGDYSSSVKIKTELPELGLYKGNEINDDNYIGTRVTYDNDMKTYYILAAENGDEGGHREINIMEVRLEDGHDVFVDYDISSDKKSVEVKLDKRKVSRFSLRVMYEARWVNVNDDNPQDFEEREMRFSFDPTEALASSRTGYLDGQPQQGYSGRWILKGDFDLSDPGVTNDEISSYWVHADTMQGVIDKLSETEIGEDFEGYYMDFETGQYKKIDDRAGIFNTGYIQICPSSCGDIELTPQYVASSGNFKGIRFDGYSQHACFTPVDADGNYEAVTGHTGGKLDYVERPAWDACRILEIIDDPVIETIDDDDDGIEDRKITISDKLKMAGRTDLVEQLQALQHIKSGLGSDIITQLKEVKYVYLSDNKLYPMKENKKTVHNRDLGKDVTSVYFTLEDKEPICEMAGLEEFICGEINNIIGWGADDKETGVPYTAPHGEMRVGETVAGLHVNVYCDMVFSGDFKKLVVGYPKDTKYTTRIVEGHELQFCEIGEDGKPRLDEHGNKIYYGYHGDLETYKFDVNTNSLLVKSPRQGDNGYKKDAEERTYKDLKNENNTDIGIAYYYGKKFEYPVTTYQIDTVSDVSDSSKDMGLSVAAPEPNSIIGLSYEQRDEIEKGKRFTVSVSANDLDAGTGLTDNETKAISEIDKLVKPNADTRIDYIDFNVNAKVDGIDESTTVSELHVPLWITMKIPGGYKKGTDYKITRYHDGKVDTLTLKDDLYGEFGGLNKGFVIDEKNETITLLADRFSVYALVREGGKTEIDFSNTSWDYKEAFTADGAVKKVSLTGLPKGVAVTYTGNEAKEAGSYNATATIKLTDEKNYKLPASIPDKIKSLAWEIKAAPASAPVTTDTTTSAPTTPKPAEVGATVNDTTAGSSATATYTVTDKSTGTEGSGKAVYSGETAGSTSQTVTIPDTVTGTDGVKYEITKIADNALKNNKVVKELTVGNNIGEIGQNALSGATNLNTVKLGTGVVTIAKNAFAGCTRLKTVKVSGNKLVTVSEAAFKGDKALTSIDLSKGKVRTIGKNAFNGDAKLKNIKLNGNSLSKVGKNAFKGINKSATITIYAKNKKTFNKAKKLVVKSGAKKVKYKFVKKK